MQKQLECIHGIHTPRTSPYVARSIPPVVLRMGIRVALLTVTTMCDFERGGATKPIIGSSWNSSVKNHLDLYQVQKRPSMIMLIVFHWLRMTSVNAFATLLEAFFNIFCRHTHTDTKALLYPCCACARGVTTFHSALSVNKFSFLPTLPTFCVSDRMPRMRTN